MSSTQASTCSVMVSFTTFSDNDATVTGVARGLDLDGNSSASGVEITSAFGAGEYVLPGAVAFNSWTLDDGFVTNIDFVRDTLITTPRPTPTFALAFTTSQICGAEPGTGLAQDRRGVFNGQTPHRLRLEEAVLTDPAPVVPLPAAGWMLIAGLGGLAAVRRAR